MRAESKPIDMFQSKSVSRGIAEGIAICTKCGLNKTVDYSAASIARRHVQKTGHRVDVWNETHKVYSPTKT